MTNLSIPTPELDKQLSFRSQASTLTDFYDWLRQNGYHIVQMDEHGITGGGQGDNPEQLFADFFGIDRDKIETERRAILAALANPETQEA